MKYRFVVSEDEKRVEKIIQELSVPLPRSNRNYINIVHFDSNVNDDYSFLIAEKICKSLNNELVEKESHLITELKTMQTLIDKNSKRVFSNSILRKARKRQAQILDILNEVKKE